MDVNRHFPEWMICECIGEYVVRGPTPSITTEVHSNGTVRVLPRGPRVGSGDTWREQWKRSMGTGTGGSRVRIVNTAAPVANSAMGMQNV